MTPEEARQKWCPMVRHSDGHDEPAWNRATGGFPIGSSWLADSGWNLCVADACMFWRWQSFRGGVGFSGYCGLAGKEGAP